jgi:hypothetical protein
MRLGWIRRPWAAAIVVSAALSVAAVGGVAAASTSSVTPPKPTTATIYGCVSNTRNPAARILTRVYWHASDYVNSGGCPAGTTALAFNGTGPAGQPGKDAIQTVSAQTVVTNWPEGSGWADDNFNRTVTLTREGAAPASDCGPTATSCWFYTETLADNGTFTTVNGAASPNGSSTAKIAGANTGDLVGGGKLEFYANSNTPNPALVPGTANGSSKPSGTTGWYKLFFPAGTQFGLTSGANVPWLSYDWTYTLPSTCEKWNDGINPGDDGQGSGDGNITGVSACTR